VGTVHVLYDKDDALGALLRGAVNATPLPETPQDEFFDILSGVLEEPATVSDSGTLRRRTDDVALLREANARLRAVAIQLSNLVGDLPVLR
jgi:hypothetical protein